MKKMFLITGLIFTVTQMLVSSAVFGKEKSLISGRPIGELAVAGRLDIDLHADIMVSRTFENDTALNWYSCGYSGGGEFNEAGGNFGDFGLHVPYTQRDKKYPHWQKIDQIPMVAFDGDDIMKGNFPVEDVAAGDEDFAIEIWVRNSSVASGETILSWQSPDARQTSAPLLWPENLRGSAQWRHIVVNCSGDQENWYVDGKSIQNGPRRMKIGSGHIMVLGGASSGDPSFSGEMAAVRLHTEAMNAEDIQQNFKGGVMLGTTLHPNIDPEAENSDNRNFKATWSDANPEEYFLEESEHFRHRIPLSRINGWSEKDRKEFYSRIPGMFKMAEDCYHYYGERLALRMPLVSRKKEYRGDGIKYKIQIGGSDGGSWMGWHGKLGFGYGLQAPGHINPHELVHGCQSQTGGGLQGNYWEVHANFPQTYAGIYQTVPASLCSKNCMFFPGNGRMYYHSRLMFEHLAQTPEYGPMFISKLWYDGNGEINEYPWLVFKRHDPDPSTTLSDEWNRMAQKNITWDYEIYGEKAPDLYRDDVERNYEDVLRYGRVLLEEIPYEKGWWRAPKEMTPQQFGWNICPLKINAGRITVKLDGYINPERGSDWRASLVAVSGRNQYRASDIIAPGETLDFNLRNNERKLYLVVSATPEKIMPIDMTGDFRSPEQEKFVYKVQLAGCEPLDVLRQYYFERRGNGRAHPNGGGFVAPTARVAPTAYVGSGAMVLGNSQVLNNARIEDNAVVKDALVRDNAVVSGHALVDNNATVKDFAKVRDFGRVTKGATLGGFAKVLEHGTQSDKPCEGYAVIKGVAVSFGSVTGTAMIDGSYAKGNIVDKGKWFTWSWGKGQNDGEVDEEFGGLYTRMTFERQHAWMAWDDFGATWGYLVNGPRIMTAGDRQTGFINVANEQGGNVLALNGRDQFVELPSDVADMRDMTLKVTVNWQGDENERIIEFTNEKGDRLYLSPAVNGKCRFAIHDGKTEQAVEGPALPKKQPTDLMVVLSENTARLFIDGEEAARNERMTLNPDIISNAVCYLGRGMDGHYFKGTLDNLEIYSVPVMDEVPPTPNPAAYAIPPLSVRPDTIVMQAMPAADPLGDVEYFFAETTDNDGGDDSGWIEEPFYKDSGLNPDLQYAYTVKARDVNGNETMPSRPVAATWVSAPVIRSSDGKTIVVEAEDFHRSVPGTGEAEGVAWRLSTRQNGFAGRGLMVALPDTGKNIGENYESQCPRLDYIIDFPAKGNYCVWVRGYGANPNSDSLHYGLDMKSDKQMQNVQLGSGSFKWNRHRHITFSVDEPGIHTFSIWMREDGAAFDRFIITNDLQLKEPGGMGPRPSPYN